jgi:hypothetical protein
MRWLALVVVSFALVAAGCGGGSNESAATTETTTETTTSDTTTTEDTSTDETTTSEDTTGGTFNWTSEDCQSLVKAYVGLSAAVGAASTGQDVSPQIEQFSKYVDEVPEEIRADVQTLASAYGEFATKLKDLGYKPGDVPTAEQLQQLQAASDSLGPDIQAAGERVSAWTSKNCGS